MARNQLDLPPPSRNYWKKVGPQSKNCPLPRLSRVWFCVGFGSKCPPLSPLHGESQAAQQVGMGTMPAFFYRFCFFFFSIFFKKMNPPTRYWQKILNACFQKKKKRNIAHHRMVGDCPRDRSHPPRRPPRRGRVHHHLHLPQTKRSPAGRRSQSRSRRKCTNGGKRRSSTRTVCTHTHTRYF